MKRRGIFGVMAGLFGGGVAAVPVAAATPSPENEALRAIIRDALFEDQGAFLKAVFIDAQGAGPREIAALRAQMPEIARKAVEDAARRGGSFGRTIRGG